jgi:YD repeat-containing protein
LIYDPVGRLYQANASGVAATRFAYDGAALIAEYNASGTLLRRFSMEKRRCLPIC